MKRQDYMSDKGLIYNKKNPTEKNGQRIGIEIL